jgi:hypothetical protein
MKLAGLRAPERSFSTMTAGFVHRFAGGWQLHLRLPAFAGALPGGSTNLLEWEEIAQDISTEDAVSIVTTRARSPHPFSVVPI